MKKAVIALVVALLVVIGVLVIKNSKKPSAATTDSTSQSAQTSQSQTNDKSSSTTQTPAASSDTITYSASGFNPTKLTVKAGTAVTVKNDSGQTMQFNSDPHPQHTANSELNIGRIAAGQSATMTLTKKGTWGFHNHLNPSDTGSITVE